MRDALLSIRDRLDGLGVVLSGLCAVHCVLGLVLVTLLGLGGLGSQAWLSPRVHEIGLALAVGIGVITLGLSALRHGRLGPLAIGTCGLALMAAALAVSHGPREAVLTILGVALVATAHIQNLRRTG
ncbi:MAG: MerC domain-containing protein [Pseudomonadota bacterium]